MLAPSMIDSLMMVAQAFCRVDGRSLARIATLVFNDGKKFDLIARGKDLTTRSWEMAMCWFSDHWPEGEPWPEGIGRPMRSVPALARGESKAEQIKVQG